MLFQKDCGSDRTVRRGPPARSARLEPARAVERRLSAPFSSPPRPPPSLKRPSLVQPRLPCTCRARSELNSRKKSSAPTRHLAQKEKERWSCQRARGGGEDRHWSAAPETEGCPRRCGQIPAIAEKRGRIPASEGPALPFTRLPSLPSPTALTPMNLCVSWFL